MLVLTAENGSVYLIERFLHSLAYWRGYLRALRLAAFLRKHEPQKDEIMD